MTTGEPVDCTRRRFLQAGALTAVCLAPAAALAAREPRRRDPDRADEASKALVRLKQLPAAHPRLHFDAKGTQLLRARAASSHQRFAQRLLAWTDQNRRWAPPDPASPQPLNEVALEQSAAFLTNAALAFVVSQKAEHLDLARRWAVAMCPPAPQKETNYAWGIYAAGLAKAYDWLYDRWTDEERRTLRTRIAQLIERMYAGSFAGTAGAHWWAGVHLHHDFWVPVGGYGEAALALLGEVDEAARWAMRAKLEFNTCFSWLGDDGAWHEGAADWCYALAPLLWFYGAWQSVTGENPHDLPWLRQTARFRLYNRLPDGSYVYLNDSFRSGRYNTSGSASCHLLRRLAALFHDGHAQWLAERDEAFDLKTGAKGVYQAPYESLSFRPRPTEYPHSAAQCAAWNLLWYDPTVSPQSPDDLPKSHRFGNQDLAVLRTGWDSRVAVVSLCCGPLGGQRCAARIRRGEPRSQANFNHVHANYNSLTLFAAGQYFLVPPGYARRASRFQNCVAANGADLTTDPAADVRIVGLLQEPDFSYVVGDATRAFLAAMDVESYRRHLLLLDDCLVVYDDLRLASRNSAGWNQFQWTVHSDPQTHALRVARSSVTWQARRSPATPLVLDVLEPQAFAWEQATLQAQEGTAMLEALRLVRPEWPTASMQVLAVFSWAAGTPLRPAEFRRDACLGVAWPEHPERPAVAFARSALGKSAPAWLAQPAFPSRSLLLLSGDRASLDRQRWDKG